MRRILSYVLTVLVSVMVSVGGIYLLMHYYPNEVVKTITEKNVNITDTGISESVSKVEDSVVVVQTYNKNTLIETGSSGAEWISLKEIPDNLISDYFKTLIRPVN